MLITIILQLQPTLNYCIFFLNQLHSQSFTSSLNSIKYQHENNSNALRCIVSLYSTNNNSSTKMHPTIKIEKMVQPEFSFFDLKNAQLTDTMWFIKYYSSTINLAQTSLQGRHVLLHLTSRSRNLWKCLNSLALLASSHGE